MDRRWSLDELWPEPFEDARQEVEFTRPALRLPGWTQPSPRAYVRRDTRSATGGRPVTDAKRCEYCLTEVDGYSQADCLPDPYTGEGPLAVCEPCAEIDRLLQVRRRIREDNENSLGR